MGRPRTNARKTTIGIPSDLEGWLSWRTQGEGLSSYLWGLVRADRERAIEDDATREAYRRHIATLGIELVEATERDDAPTVTDPREAARLLGR